eukprot:4316157-Pyramimonas_sp.AAC.1
MLLRLGRLAILPPRDEIASMTRPPPPARQAPRQALRRGMIVSSPSLIQLRRGGNIPFCGDVSRNMTNPKRNACQSKLDHRLFGMFAS